ncbi:MAG: site-specific integrase [Thermodesulfobacteriota bacterium]
MPYKRGPIWVGEVRREGGRRQKLFPTKKEALDWETKQRRKPLREWEEGPRTVMACGEWAQAYMDYAASRFSPKTYGEKQTMFRRFFQEVDPALPVTQLTPAKVLSYVRKQKEERSGNGANKDRKNLVAAWNWGMKYIDPPLHGPNPCLVDRMPEERKRRYVPPVPHFWRVFEAAEDFQDRVMLLTFLHTAARRSEVFKLRWDDVDFARRQIRLGTRKRLGGTLEYDWIPLTDDLFETLDSWKERRSGMPFKGEAHVFICLEETPFCGDYYGRPFTQRRHFMKRLCDRAGVKPFGFHAIRHLTASILAEKGIPAIKIQAILRHKNLATTERYLHDLSGLRQALRVLPGNKKPSEEPSTPQKARPRLKVVG